MNKVMHSMVIISTMTLITATHAESPFSMDGKTMIGDWNGKRTALAEQGIKLDGTIASDGSYLADGGYDAHQSPTLGTQFGLGAALDF